MRNSRICVAIVGICLAVAGAVAQQSVDQAPGYFPLEEMGIFAEGGVEVDVDLQGPMIQMMAAAAAEKDPKFGELASQLQRIRVRVGSLDAENRDGVQAAFDGALERLDSAGWDPMVKVDEGDELVRVFVKQGAATIEGITVLVNDSFEEAVLVNIVGEMDPELVGRLIGSMDQMPDLDELGIEID
jgi:hypothetical protein